MAKSIALVLELKQIEYYEREMLIMTMNQDLIAAAKMPLAERREH